MLRGELPPKKLQPMDRTCFSIVEAVNVKSGEAPGQVLCGVG
jgi:hypothetical protein